MATKVEISTSQTCAGLAGVCVSGWRCAHSCTVLCASRSAQRFVRLLSGWMYLLNTATPMSSHVRDLTIYVYTSLIMKKLLLNAFSLDNVDFNLKVVFSSSVYKDFVDLLINTYILLYTGCFCCCCWLTLVKYSYYEDVC